jgi:type II secretory pathway component PulF
MLMSALCASGEFPRQLVLGIKIAELFSMSSPLATFSHKKIPIVQQVAFAEGLADLLESGLALRMALLAFAEQKDLLGAVVSRLNGQIAAGQLFSQAIKKEQRYFDALFPFFVQIGEASGELAKALRDLERFLKNRSEVEAEIKKQLFYPAMVLSAAGFSFFLLIRYLFPAMVTLFEGSGTPLPGGIRLLLRMISLADRYFFVLAGSGLCTAFTIYKYRQDLGDIMSRTFPWIQRVHDLFWLGKFIQNSAVLARAGVPLLENLSIQKNMYAQSSFRSKLDKMLFWIKQGGALSQALARELVPGAAILQIVRLAEASGDLPRALQNAGQLIEKELTHKIRTFVKWLEPAVTLLLGVFVGLLVLIAFYPLTKILASLG